MANTGIAFSIFGIDIYWYGLIITCGILLAVLISMYLAKKRGYNSEMLIDLALIAVPVGIIGARLYYVIFSFDEFAGRLDTIFTLRMTGLAIYGGVIGGALAAFIFSKWRKVSFWDIADSCLPSVIFAQALGRWGNFFNQEVYGAVVNSASAQIGEHLSLFPPAVFIESDGQWHVALFLMESVWNLLSFLFMLWLWKKMPQKRGVVASSYMILYGCGRFVLEGLRLQEYTLYFLGMPVSQLVSLLLVAAGVILLVISLRKNGLPIQAIPERYQQQTEHTSETPIDDNIGEDSNG